MAADNLPAPEDIRVLRTGSTYRPGGRDVGSADMEAVAPLARLLHDPEGLADRSDVQSQRLAKDMLLLSHALTLARVDSQTFVGVRRIRNVTFVRPLHAGDEVWVEVDIDRVRKLSDVLVVAEVSCLVLNQRGETLAELRADFLHRQAARPAWAPDGPVATFAPDRDEPDCVETIPV